MEQRDYSARSHLVLLQEKREFSNNNVQHVHIETSSYDDSKYLSSVNLRGVLEKEAELFPNVGP